MNLAPVRTWILWILGTCWNQQEPPELSTGTAAFTSIIAARGQVKSERKLLGVRMILETLKSMYDFRYGLLGFTSSH